MTEPVFRDAMKVQVRAKGASLWTRALPYVQGGVRLRINVADEHTQWSLGAGTCGPGGSYTVSPTSLLPFAPVGALIGKVGGSDADCPAPSPGGGAPQAPPGSRLFAVGQYCVIELKSTESGPLFLTMNDDVARFADHDGELTVTVAIAVG